MDAQFSFICVITAKHIVEGIKQQTIDQKVYIRVNLKDKPAEAVETSLSSWMFHPTDPSVDVAMIPWAPPPDVVDYLPISISMAATDKIITSEAIGVGDEVFLTGLFAKHYGVKKNLPIVRIGNIALMPEEKVQTQDLGVIDAYLVEARSIGGLSGSPVFVNLAGIRRVGKTSQLKGGVFYWLGLMHGHWDLPVLDIDDLTKDALTKERINMGIAIVVPAMKVLEVINRKELVEGRAKAVEKRRKEKAPTPDDNLRTA